MVKTEKSRQVKKKKKKNVDLQGFNNWEWVVKEGTRISFAGNWVDQR